MVSWAEAAAPPALIQMSRKGLAPTLFVPPRMMVVALAPPPMIKRSVTLVLPTEPVMVAVAFQAMILASPSVVTLPVMTSPPLKRRAPMPPWPAAA